MNRRTPPDLLQWLKEQDSYANEVFGKPSLAKARKDLQEVLDRTLAEYSTKHGA